MKHTKKINLSIITIVSLLLIGTFFFKVSSKTITENEWLSKNNISINIKNNDDFSGFDILKSDLNKYDVFLTGELHGVSINHYLDLKFLKYFVKNADVKYFLIEASPCKSYLLNEYINKGNPDILNKFLYNSFSSQGWSKEAFEKWKEIYKFNNTLPKNHKIQVLGIDINDSPNTYFSCLMSIINKYKIPNKLYVDIKNFKKLEPKLEYSSYKDQSKIVEKYIKSVTKNDDLYKKCLDKDFENFKYILDNFYYSLIWLSKPHGSDEFFNYREKKMYDNFKRIYSNFPKGKYYGHFSNDQLYQKGTSLASCINENDLRDKVLSIQTIYENSFYSILHDNQHEQFPVPKLNRKLTTLLKPLNSSNTVLFKIYGENSPFSSIKDSKYFQTNTKIDKKSLEKYCLQDYFQYFILVRNAKPTAPLK